MENTNTESQSQGRRSHVSDGKEGRGGDGGVGMILMQSSYIKINNNK